ncbi:MAG: NAD(P)H-dependent oxidoreductase subunit E [Chitinivibrionales bacterium]|nr:NAD(P)H-dependent oxidoreductase subunit E [Chitinivibrionales bacterium]
MNGNSITEIVEKNQGHYGGMITILEEVQKMYGYLPKDVLIDVAEKAKKPLVEIYGVATFYKAFRLHPKGKHLITVCSGTACHVRNSIEVVEEFKRELGIDVNQTTEDKEFTLETVACLGSCALGPIVVIDGHYFSRVSRASVAKLIAVAKEGFDAVDVATNKTIFPVEVICPHCHHSFMDPAHPIDGKPSIKITVSFNQTHGWVRLSSLYGSYTVQEEYPVPTDSVVNTFCPHCHKELSGNVPCLECNTPMMYMKLRGAAALLVCAKRGCKGHMLEVGDSEKDDTL